jgi:hypothetical protein
MRVLLCVLTLVVSLAVPASALVTVQTAAGIPITVSSEIAGRMQALIADLVSAGYRPRHIGCYAGHGHIPGSRHHSGNACDFDQTGWNRTSGFMYHAGAIIARHGLRDGCTFRGRRDCGHVDDGISSGRHYRHVRYARTHHRRHRMTARLR